MPIYRFLQKSAFEPEDIKLIGQAYELALVELGMKDRNDPLTETIAKLIIETAQTGEKDPQTMCAVAVRRVQGPDREAG